MSLLCKMIFYTIFQNSLQIFTIHSFNKWIFSTTMPILTDSEWKERLQAVIDFRNITSKLPSQLASDPNEKKLAHWRGHNSSLLNRGLLNKERADLFIKAGLQEDHSEASWNSMLNRTVAFVERYNRFPTRDGATKEERSIGRWRTDQYYFYKKGKLSDKQAQIFEESNLLGNVNDITWHKTLKDVVQFKKKYGHLPIITGSAPDEERLAIWCTKIRTYYNKGKLNTRQLTLARAAGIFENRGSKDRWPKSYKRLLAFCKTNKRLPTRLSIGEEQTIYVWLKYQLNLIKKNQLSDDRVQLLKRISTEYKDEYGTLESKWHTMYKRVGIFYEKNNKLPSENLENKIELKLYRWLDRQKKAFRNKLLNTQQTKLLKALHPEMNNLEQWARSGVSKRGDIWKIKYDKVKDIIDKTGHLPASYNANKEEKNLYQWLKRQRDANLSPIKRKLIEQLDQRCIKRPIPKKDSLWIEKLNEVKAFFEQNGRLPVKTENATDNYEFSLARWRLRYSSEFKRGILDKGRAEMFRAAGLVSN